MNIDLEQEVKATGSRLRWAFVADDNAPSGLRVYWEESQHPRHPPGSSQGGEFAPKDTPEEQQELGRTFAAIAADPRVVKAEYLALERGDVRKDPGVLDALGKYMPAASAENRKIAESFLDPGAKPAPGDPPVAVVVLGKPGAGKSTLLRSLPGLPRSVNVNPDDVMSRIPGYSAELAPAFHNRASDIVGQNLLPMAIGGGYNITLDVSGRNPAKMEGITRNLKVLGYHTVVIHADVDTLTAVRRAHERFLRDGRYVPVSMLADNGYRQGTRESYQRIKAQAFADEWRQYDTREGQKLVDAGARVGASRLLGGFNSGGAATGSISRHAEEEGRLAEEGAAILQQHRPTPGGEGQEVAFAFDPNQPRDDHGRWVDTGAGGVLRQYLEMVAPVGGRREGWKYNNIEDFVLRNGRAFKAPVILPPGVQSRKLGECFKNAYQLADLRPDLTYVEGFVAVHRVPIAHAWTVDKRDRVVDPTLFGKGKTVPRGMAYFGVKMPIDFVRRTIVARGKYGVLDNMEQRFPVIKDGIPGVAEHAQWDEFRFDPNQPRDKQGRWTVGHLSTLDRKIIDFKPDRPLHPDAPGVVPIESIIPNIRLVPYSRMPFFGALNKLVGVDPRTEPIEKYIEARKKLFEGKKVQKVLLDSLVATQPYVNSHRVAELVAKEEQPKPIMSVRYRGESYVIDGHHHVIAAVLKGKQTTDGHLLRARELNLDKKKYIKFFGEVTAYYAGFEDAVAGTLQNLASLAREADGILIVSDGVVEEPTAEGQYWAGGWEESRHPRHPKGSPEGGEFAPQDNVVFLDPSDKMLTAAMGEAKGFRVSLSRWDNAGARQLLVETPNRKGFAAAVIWRSKDNDSPSGWRYTVQQHDISLPESMRGRGLGRAMMDALYAAYKAVGVRQIPVHLATNPDFWGHMSKRYPDLFRDYTEWDESKHPRHPKGDDRGGEFAPTVPGFAGTLSTSEERLKREGLLHQVTITSSFSLARDRAVNAAMGHIGGVPVVVELSVPREEVAKVGPRMVGGKYSFTADKVPAAWVHRVVDVSRQATYSDDGGMVRLFTPLVLLKGRAKEFSLEKPLYVYRAVTNADQIIAWAKEQGFEATLPAEDMHVTIAFSKQPVDWMAMVPVSGQQPRWEGEASELEIPTGARRVQLFVYNPSQARDRFGKWTDENKVFVPAPDPRSLGLLWRTGKEAFVTNEGYGRTDVAARINQRLRAGKLLDKYDQEIVDRLDKVMGKNKLEGDYQFYHGGTITEHAGRWVNAGYLSVSSSIDQAGAFKWRGPVSIIRVPKGTHYALGDWHEQEYILPRGGIYRRVGTTEDGVPILQYGRHVTTYAQAEEDERRVLSLGDGGVVVLIFEAPILHERWQWLVDHGASWDYEEYHPHITITYDKPEGLDLDAVVPYAGPIRLGPEVFEEVKEGWHEGVKEHADDRGDDHAQALPALDEAHFAQVKKDLDALEEKSKEELKKVFTKQRDALERRIRASAGDLHAALDGLVLPYKSSDLQPAILAMLQRAYERGGRDAAAEVMTVVKEHGQWDESKHPRKPAGTSQGGEFAPLYHGSSAAIIEQVREQGLIPNAEIFNKKMRTKVWVTSLLETAKHFAEKHAEIAGVIFEVYLPETAPLKDLPVGWPGSYAHEGKITPEHIKRFALYDVKTKHLGPWQPFNKGVKKFQASGVFYAVELISDEHTYARADGGFNIFYSPRSAMKWLRAKALWVTGVTSDRIIAETKNILLQSLKTGDPIGVIIDRLFELFDPYIGTKVEPEVVAPYRLETIVRTNTTESYNQGRLQEFLNPKIARFVDGVRYTAILDERTTPVCRFLDDKVFKPDSADLVSLTPPNHFNCRSLLTPIVVGMKVDPSEFITAVEVAKARSLADQKFLSQDNEGDQT